MRRRSLFAGLALLAVASLAAGPIANSAGTFKIDPVHSSTFFRITHFGVGAVYGTVKSPTGTIEQDDKGLTKIEVTLDLEKIDTANAQRDTHLKGPDFFNAKQFPQMSFKSTKVEPAGENAYSVTGDLTIKGKTVTKTVTITKLGEGAVQGQTRVGYETKFVVNRLEHGVDWQPGAVGNDVDVWVAVEGVKQ